MDGLRRFCPQRAAEWAAVGFTDAPPLAVRAAPAAVTAPWDRAVLEAPAVVVDAHTCAKLSRRQLGALLAGGKVRRPCAATCDRPCGLAGRACLLAHCTHAVMCRAHARMAAPLLHDFVTRGACRRCDRWSAASAVGRESVLGL